MTAQRAHRTVGSGGRPQDGTVGLRYQNAKFVLTVAGDPLAVRMARSRT